MTQEVINQPCDYNHKHKLEVQTEYCKYCAYRLHKVYIPSCVRSPSYSTGSPFFKILIVGYPETSNLLPRELSLVASTFATGIGGSFSFRVCAICSYSGANCLQCPHLSGKQQTSSQTHNYEECAGNYFKPIGAILPWCIKLDQNCVFAFNERVKVTISEN